MTSQPPTESVWSMGARTVTQAVTESGLTRDRLWQLMRDGTLPWFAHGGRGMRLIAWKAIVEYLAGEHEKSVGSADARTD